MCEVLVGFDLPTQYITNVDEAMNDFLVLPATLAIPMLTIRLVTGAKKPIRV